MKRATVLALLMLFGACDGTIKSGYVLRKEHEPRKVWTQTDCVSRGAKNICNEHAERLHDRAATWTLVLKEPTTEQRSMWARNREARAETVLARGGQPRTPSGQWAAKPAKYLARRPPAS